MKVKALFLLLTMCVCLAGCSNQGQKTVVSSVIRSSPEGTDGNADTPEGSFPAEPETSFVHKPDTGTVETSEPGEQIKAQTFDVELDGWGKVTFASFWPKESAEGNGDVQFKLLQEEDIIYDFPQITPGYESRIDRFLEVAAVAFKDYNNDGKKDVIVINHYDCASGTGNSNTQFYEVRLYTQPGEGKEFLYDKLLSHLLNENHSNDSISSVLEGMAACQEALKSEAVYYGEFCVTAWRGSAAVSALSQEEIQDFIGTDLTYEADDYACNGTVTRLQADVYRKEVYPPERLYTDFKVNPSDLSIGREALLFVSVSMEGNGFGSDFFVLDDDTLLIYYEGCFFEANRMIES